MSNYIVLCNVFVSSAQLKTTTVRCPCAPAVGALNQSSHNESITINCCSDVKCNFIRGDLSLPQYIRQPYLMPVHFSRANKIRLLWNVSPITQSNLLRFIRDWKHFLLHGFITLSGNYRASFPVGSFILLM